LENIPPESSFGLTTKQPSIYYGESMPGYRIVATGVKEFDYPKGNQNVYTSYAGTGGHPAGQLVEAALVRLDPDGCQYPVYILPQTESKIQIWRRVQERVQQIAPFLRLDQDPYAVVSEGKQYWIQDAYTVSDHFPYSTPSRRPLRKG
jgi:uncharacterized membrane protein (UPF0182 family)